MQRLDLGDRSGTGRAQSEFHHQPNRQNEQDRQADTDDDEMGGLAVLEIPFAVARALYAQK